MDDTFNNDNLAIRVSGEVEFREGKGTIVVKGTEIALRAIVAMPPPPPEPAPPEPSPEPTPTPPTPEQEWYSPEKYPLNPNGYQPIAVLGEQTPVSEFYPPGGVPHR